MYSIEQIFFYQKLQTQVISNFTENVQLNHSKAPIYT